MEGHFVSIFLIILKCIFTIVPRPYTRNIKDKGSLHFGQHMFMICFTQKISNNAMHAENIRKTSAANYESGMTYNLQV